MASSDTPAPPSSRRVPPPCWSTEETLALIDSYHEKWASLRRGNLRAHHWQEVADAVAVRSPHLPRKTALQCRHKVEKLRKRYRSERARCLRLHTPGSAWAFYRQMDAMERQDPRSASSSPAPSSSASGDDYPRRPSLANGGPGRGLLEMRRKVEGKRTAPAGAFGMVAEALSTMCDGYVRMERLKMDMASEMHRHRMDMELKRTEMMLESQRRIVDTFLEGIRVNAKRPRLDA